MPKPTMTEFYELLEERREIALIWSIEDVLAVREDLDDVQAWRVLQECERCYEYRSDITYEFIEHIASIVFPPGEAGGGQ
jgi:hypothetical protein